MPDIGWTELLLIGVVALIVVGPKDLPMMFRRLGQFTGRIKAMARDFQRAMDEAADESGMTELNRDLRTAAQYTRNPAKAGASALKDAFGDVDLDAYPEGSETRATAEKRADDAKATREKTADLRAAQAGKTDKTDKTGPKAAKAPNGDARPAEAPDAVATPEPKAEPEPAATRSDAP